MLTKDDVADAAARIRGRVRRTPLSQVAEGESPLWLKCEFLQHTGVFKTRGAFNRILAARERGDLVPAVGIVAASGGNAGLANAYAARALGVPATVFVPETAPRVKVERLRGYGANVRQVGAEYAEANAAGMAFAEEAGAVFCHAYDQPEIVAGAGTLGAEILEDEPTIDTILVAVGGGGLLAGILTAVGDRVRLVAVEPRNAPTLHSALAAGRPVDVTVSGVAADSLGARRVGAIAWETVSYRPPVSVLVEDADIVAARERLWTDYRVAAEHGAAAAFAALTAGAYVPAAGERVAVVVCGANTDPRTLEGSA